MVIKRTHIILVLFFVNFAVFIIGIKCLVTKTEFKQLIPLLGPKYFTPYQLKVIVWGQAMRSLGKLKGQLQATNIILGHIFQ